MADDTDCDDTDAATWPGAPEVWYDGVDQACDGGSDYDADADGYDGSDWGGDDCLDTEAAVNPAAAEVCNDRVDNDCDGAAPGCAPEGTASLADGWARLLGETDYDRLGVSVGTAGDVDGSGRSALLVAAYHASDDRGAVYLITKGRAGSATAVSIADTIYHGEESADDFGYDVDAAGDVDADGYLDIFVSAKSDDTAGGSNGAAYLLSTDASGEYNAGFATAKILGETPDDMFAMALAGAGDLDGDGYDDLIAGTMRGGGMFSGVAYVFLGPVSGTVYAEDADAVLDETDDFDGLGTAMDGGVDLDGDGLADFVVSARMGDDVSEDGGAVYVYTHVPLGPGDTSSADAVVGGESVESMFGASVSIAGDINGDGTHDLLVGDQCVDTSVYAGGAIHVFLGPITGTRAASGADAVIYGTRASEQLGDAVDTDDFDQDGFDDVLAVGMDGSGRVGGRAMLAYGPVLGTLTIDDAELVLEPEMPSSTLWSDAAAVGDFDGDTYPDFLVGSPYVSDSDYYQGAAYLWLGGGF